MREKEFSLQLVEATTSINNKDTYLICYVRFIDNDDNIVEDLLFCKPILTNCTAQELFKILNNFIHKNNLEWKYCVGLCTDGARAMSGRLCTDGARAVSGRLCTDGARAMSGRLCTDGARAVSGRLGGLRTLVQDVAVNAKWTHCIIHREALASQQLSGDLNGVLEVVVLL